MARRQFNVFNLSFLDVMACGFGAIILFFMIINSQVKSRSNKASVVLQSQTEFLEEEIIDGQKRMVTMKNEINKIDEDNSIIQGSIDELLKVIEDLSEEISQYENRSLASKDSVEKLKSDIKILEKESKRMSSEAEKQSQLSGDSPFDRGGEGQRQYISGCKVSGQRVLFLVDSSTSMLANSYANALLFSIYPDEEKIRAPKWSQVVKGVEWMATRLKGEFQIYTFNESAQSVLEQSDGEWIKADSKNIVSAIDKLALTVPQGGNSLFNAFEAINAFSIKPDNIFLFTDGLPTLGSRIPNSPVKVYPNDRQKYFNRAIDVSPGIPMNVFLFPLDGDPTAAASFINLAGLKKGCFVSPSKDWPTS
jgi:hypothetical protein|tara:strand:+ start:280 stop:1371 length:1092 start_codon:yes stop_codon:yes gene_type:complete